MTTVICKNSEHTVSIEECWCVIDAKQKERYYECKKTCTPPSIQSIEPIAEEIEIGLGELETVAETIEHELERQEREVDWIERYPRRSVFQWIRDWFQRPTGYAKVKTS